MREWQVKNRDKMRMYSRRHYQTHREQEIIRAMKGNAKRHRELRLKALIHYGGDPPKCRCCQEERLLFLTMDHMAGNGNQHRKSVRRFGSIYEWLRHANYPLGFRVLCMNCNWALGKYKVCPHQQEGASGLGNETSP